MCYIPIVIIAKCFLKVSAFICCIIIYFPIFSTETLVCSFNLTSRSVRFNFQFFSLCFFIPVQPLFMRLIVGSFNNITINIVILTLQFNWSHLNVVDELKWEVEKQDNNYPNNNILFLSLFPCSTLIFPYNIWWFWRRYNLDLFLKK